MKTHAILIHLENLTPNHYDIDYLLQAFINYKLQPFKRLHIISSNSFKDVPSPIYGTKHPSKLISESIDWSSIATNLIKQYTHESTIINYSTISHSILELICGNYNYDAQFLNAQDLSITIGLQELQNIKTNPNEYCLYFTNVYR